MGPILDYQADMDASDHAIKAAATVGSTYSITGQFDGACVFLTGATGYIGSVLLEQLLRTTNVSCIYVLMRGRRGQPPQARLQALLASGLFHLVRDKPKLTSKVVALEGDILLPGLGLTEADRRLLQSETNIIIHCAADIRLEVDIQQTLQANYEGTRSLLDLALTCPGLRAHVHVSTAFVNANQAPHSVVDERLYPLMHGSQEVDAEELAQELLSLPKADAAARAAVLIARWAFPNTYCLGKHLAEQLVARYQRTLGLPLAIVRPTLVYTIAGAPYPGYASNFAGLLGSAAAMAIGMFEGRHAVSSWPHHVWDIIPGDATASIILATAAALGAGLAPAIAASAQSARGSGSSSSTACSPGVSAPGHSRGPSDMALQLVAAGSPSSSSRRTSDSSGGPSSSSCNTPSSPSSSKAASTSKAPSTSTTHSAAGAAPLLIVHAATSSIYPSSTMETYNWGVEFLVVHPAPFTLRSSKLKLMSPSYVPKEAAIRRSVQWTGVKVKALAGLLGLVGQQRQARKLLIGHEQYVQQNTLRTDLDLTFSTHALVELAWNLDPSERPQRLLLWRPSPWGKGSALDKTLYPTEVTWRRYRHTAMAGVYRRMFGVDIPRVMSERAVKDTLKTSRKHYGGVVQPIEHDFVHIK